MAPAADFGHNITQYESTFTMANISPQVRFLHYIYKHCQMTCSFLGSDPQQKLLGSLWSLDTSFLITICIWCKWQSLSCHLGSLTLFPDGMIGSNSHHWTSVCSYLLRQSMGLCTSYGGYIPSSHYCPIALLQGDHWETQSRCENTRNRCIPYPEYWYYRETGKDINICICDVYVVDGWCG